MNNTLNEKKIQFARVVNFNRWSVASFGSAELAKAENIFFSGVGTDTRKDLSGQIFLHLRAMSLIRMIFLDKAIEAKAAALVVHNQEEIFFKNQTNSNVNSSEITQEQQKNSDPIKIFVNAGNSSDLGYRHAEGPASFANYYRRQLPSRVLAITGSNGKTTSKEFSAAVLSTVFSNSL